MAGPDSFYVVSPHTIIVGYLTMVFYLDLAPDTDKFVASPAVIIKTTDTYRFTRIGVQVYPGSGKFR